MNLMLHSVSNPKIEKRDSVSKDYDEEEKYNLILANPPFKGSLNKENISDKLKGITNTIKSEWLFVGLFIQMLKVESQKSLEKTQMLFNSLMQQYFG